MVTISFRYNQHRLNCVMKKGIRHTEQTVEHTWERCRWARKAGPFLVLRGKEEFLHLANTLDVFVMQVFAVRLSCAED